MNQNDLFHDSMAMFPVIQWLCEVVPLGQRNGSRTGVYPVIVWRIVIDSCWCLIFHQWQWVSTVQFHVNYRPFRYSMRLLGSSQTMSLEHWVKTGFSPCQKGMSPFVPLFWACCIYGTIQILRVLSHCSNYFQETFAWDSPIGITKVLSKFPLQINLSPRK